MDQSFENREGKIWFNGELIDWKKANVHVLNHGLHYASSVFEGERSYKKKVFKEHEHTNRLIHSAKTLGFELPYCSKGVIVPTSTNPKPSLNNGL